jgi:hypothetical protein
MTVEKDPQAEHAVTIAALTGGIFDPRALPVRESAESFTKGALNLGLLRLERSITYQTGGSDCMIVHWSFSGELGSGDVVLRDTPMWSLYHIRFSSESYGSEEKLNDFLTRLIVWDHGPMGIARLHVGFARQNGAVTQFSAVTGQDLLPRYGVSIGRITGVERKDGSYVTVRISKYFGRQYYPGLPFVAERFPPLSDQVKNWDFERIKAELGREFEGLEVPDAVVNRDRILIAEAASRGLSDEQLVRLLSDPDATKLEERAGIVFGEIRLRGNVDGLHELGLALDLYGKVNGNAEAAADKAFFMVSHPCGRGFEDLALALFREHPGHRAALNYFFRCSSSERVVSAVRSYLDKNSGSTQARDVLSHITGPGRPPQ